MVVLICGHSGVRGGGAAKGCSSRALAVAAARACRRDEARVVRALGQAGTWPGLERWCWWEER